MLKQRLQKRKTLPGRTLLLLTQPSVAMLAIMLVLMQWRIPTTIRMTVTYAVEAIEQTASLTANPGSDKLDPTRIERIDIQYPDFPKTRPVILTDITAVTIESAEKLTIQELKRDLKNQELQFQLDGTVDVCRIQSNTKRRDLRLTYFDRLLRSQGAMLGLLMLWLVFTGVGWFKVYQELLKR